MINSLTTTANHHHHYQNIGRDTVYGYMHSLLEKLQRMKAATTTHSYIHTRACVCPYTYSKLYAWKNSNGGHAGMRINVGKKKYSTQLPFAVTVSLFRHVQ